MTSSRTLLITGATGKQGGALIKSILSSQPTPPFKILAVTRNPSSASAQALASKPNVSLIQGDFSDTPAIFEKAGGPGKIWGVFGVQLPAMGPFAKDDQEIVQGKALVDAAVANGVKHFVYSSVDRGGREKSDADPTYVPHFKTKFEIEKHLKEQAAKSPQKMSWTILRPVGFMGNLTPTFPGKGFAVCWQQMGGKKMQLIAIEDIGFFGAAAFKDPQKYNGEAITLVGDRLSFEEAAKIFKEEMGYDLPLTWGLVGRGIKFMLKDLGLMMKWIEETGYGTDTSELRKIHPGLQDFRTWLKETSTFKPAS